MTDTRGIGRPITFKGEESKYAEWKAKLLAYLRVIIPQSDRWIQWCCKMTTSITEDEVDLEYEADERHIDKISQGTRTTGGRHCGHPP